MRESDDRKKRVYLMHYYDSVVTELLPPYEDGVFKTLLTHEDAKPILKDIIESYLKLSVKNVVIKNIELPISDINEKRERFDVNCIIDDGSQLDVEMQADPMVGDSLREKHRIVKSRAIHHLCGLHAGQAGRSIRYAELLRSFQMTFCGYTVFPESKEFVNRFSFRDENGAELCDIVGIVFVELSKLEEIAKKPVETMTGEEAWAIFFAHASDPGRADLMNNLFNVRSEIKMAKELLQTISTDEDERARFRSRRKFQMDMDHNMKASRDEGRAEGREEGRAEVILDIAKSLKDIGIPVEQIAKATGLSHAEIESIGKKEV